MIRRGDVNRDLVSVSVDGSHEDMGRHKVISFVLAPKTPLLI